MVLLDGKGAALDADGREVDGWEHGGGAGGESGWSWYSWWIGIEISSGWHRRCDTGNGAAGEQGHAKLLGPGILSKLLGSTTLGSINRLPNYDIDWFYLS